MDTAKLLQKKRRAKTKGDFKIVAEVSKDLGDIYFQTGNYPEALEQYKDQVQACEILNDPLEVAIGNRMIGEVLTSLDRFEEALIYQNLYLVGAIQADDLIEQQRAYATLGRTQFCLSQFLEDRAQKRDALNAAKNAYITSLKTCDKFEESGAQIDTKEVMTMRARLLLNLGLVLEAKKQPDKGIQLIEKAARLCEQNNLHEDLHRSNVSLGALHERLKNYSSAQEFYQKAAKVEDFTLKERARLHEAELLVKWGKWSEARKILVQLYVHHKNSPSILETASKLLKIVAVIQSSEVKLKTEDNNRKRLEIYESMGDAASAGNAFEKALDYYRDMLACVEIGDIEEKLAPALVSLAQTLKDLEKYDEAVIYAKKELELCKDPKEICRSALYLGELLVLTSSPDTQIDEAFTTALNNAEKSGNLSLKLSVLKSMLDYSESKEDKETSSELKQQISDLKEQIPGDESSDEEDLETSLNDIKIEIDDLSDVEEEMQRKGERTVRKSRPKRVEFKRNIKGEMPLQIACIEGNKKKVQELLKQGHPVNCRDYCGWTPLHEAANYGYIEIAELLLKHGADINDPGGPQCGGITPLHDAAVCGHTVVINFLIEQGADPRLKTAKGETVLDCLEGWRKKEGVLSPEDEAEYQIIRNKLKLIIPRTPKPSPKGGTNPKASSLQPLIDPDGNADDPPMIPPDLPEEKRISAGEDYRRTIESLKSNRSRIMTPKSPKRNVAPLIDSEEALIDEDNWLEEDLEVPTPKRRSTSSNETPGSVKRKSNNLTPNEDKNPKRRRTNDADEVEVLGDSENSRDSVLSGNSDIFNVSTSNSSRIHRTKPKQKSLLAAGFTRSLDSRTPSPVFHYPDPIGSQMRGQRLDIQGRQSDSVRIEVELDDSIIKTKLRIQDDSESLITNLMNNVVGKFEERTGCRGRVELTTSSGNVLQADNIVNIIYKNEGVLRLAGRVLDLQVPSIVERFEKICRAMKVEVDDPELLRSLKSCKNTGIFRLRSDEGLDLELMPILRSLEYEKSLQVLHLSSGILYNLGESVNETLGRLTALQELHLQGCDIDHQFLGAIDHLPSQLRVLDLSYNPLGPESQEKLGELIAPLRYLQTLNLRSCRLERFPATTISSSLVNLDVSGNFIQGDSVECFLQRQIVNLSISNTYNPGNSILEVMMSGLKSIFMSLDTLELSGCNLRNSDVLEVLEKCPNLSKFVLGDNPEVTQVSLEALVGRRPTLMLINVTGCEKITRIPSFGLTIQNPSVCTLMASFSEEVCNAWRDLWGHQAIFYRQPHDIVIIRPFT
ncbi:tonsoku-like protein [Diachasma alloeum]|uniref:tonsoku-like protein n=1 Tax=Diachasma alloeum TaxID=454923 RepID=UPI0007383D27|nr:tonsoku-like protein [Diachasma alloeum]